MDSERTRCKRRVVFAAIVGAALCSTPAAADWSLSLPTFAPCSQANPPELPARWRAVGLMMPLFQGQIDVGEFVYDGKLPAMRATVYGIESGAVDLLITDTDSYLLSGPHDSPTACRSLGQKWSPPSVHWLSKRAVCIGRTRLSQRPVELWKTPGVEDQATWHWFTTGTRLPWRSVFLAHTLDPPVIGDYAMTYFPTFAPLRKTNLARLRDACRATAQRGSMKVGAAAPTARQLMAIPNKAAEAERLKRIATLVPGLSHRACSRMHRVRWRDRFVMTATLTPGRFEEDPYLSLIYYDWSDAETQLAIMLQGRPPTPKGIVSLKKRIGYRIERHASGGATCEAVFPGIVRPDWMTVAGCECKAVIDRNPALSPEGETQILSCPIKWQGKRIMWNWYRANGYPVVFMEAAAQKGGVMLADYHDWRPGLTGTAKDFELPKFCRAPGKAGAPRAPAHQTTLSNVSCSDCHTTPW